MKIRLFLIFLILMVVAMSCQSEEKDKSQVATHVTSTLTEIAALPSATISQVPSIVASSPTAIETEAPAELHIPYDSVTMAMIAAINQWRLDSGLSPLAPNSILTEMAQDQADYVISLSPIPSGGDLHIGRQGEGPRDRALYSQYSWPTYGRSDRIIIGEIAYIGANERSGVAWWKGSELHANTALNPVYREIGVGVVPHRFGHLYIVVFGGQPNGLPALIDPKTNRLYLSNERYRHAATGGWVENVQQVQILSFADGPIDANAWQPWVPYIDLPSADRIFYIAYSDGAHQVIIEVIFGEDMAWLPTNLP